MKLIVTAFMVAVAGEPAGAAETAAQNGSVLVHADGAVSVATGAFANRAAAIEERVQVRYDFGLPHQPPARRWLEEDQLPICHTQWEKDGIRYQQTVLETRLGAGEMMPGGKVAADTVLVIQITGENCTNEYAEAAAAFAMQVGGQTLNLELRDGLAYSTDTNATELVAVIDVPATGLGSTKGPRLQFQGNMPPGTSGAMTIKIPVARLAGEEAIKRLRDLEFAEEHRRVKRFWADRLKAGDATARPVAFQKAGRD